MEEDECWHKLLQSFAPYFSDIYVYLNAYMFIYSCGLTKIQSVVILSLMSPQGQMKAKQAKYGEHMERFKRPHKFKRFTKVKWALRGPTVEGP